MLVNANAKTMAKIMDLTERRINQLVAEKVINKDEDGQFNVMQHALLEKVKREMAEIELAEPRMKFIGPMI